MVVAMGYREKIKSSYPKTFFGSKFIGLFSLFGVRDGFEMILQFNAGTGDHLFLFISVTVQIQR